MTAATCRSLWVSTPATTTGLVGGVIVGWGGGILVTSRLRSAWAGGAAAPRGTGSADKTVTRGRWAQALLRSRRRRGKAPHQELPGDRHIRGKTASVHRSEGQDARERPGTGILSRPSLCGSRRRKHRPPHTHYRIDGPGQWR